MTQPNLLIILTDQLRRHALGCYGETNLQTPHIDALAESGVRFTNACSTYPICVPFRFTMMTGQYAHTRQIPGINWRMSPAERTLADEFNDAGYDTAYVGKWHLYGGSGPSFMKCPVPPEYQGRWHKWLGFEFRNSHFDSVYFEDDDPTPRPLEPYQTDGCFDVAMRHLQNRPQPEKPFCCVVSVEPPHPPYEAPAELEEKWLQCDLDVPPNFMASSEDDLRITNIRQIPETGRADALRNRQIYYAMVENLDQNVGRMKAFLQEQGLDENTIVVFLSDHGEMGGAHRLHNKQLPYEESTGIPLIINGNGIPAGRVCHEPTCTEDLFPTLCGLAGISPRDDLPGRDLSSLIRGEQHQLDRDGVMLEFVAELRPRMLLYNQYWRAFRGKRYKYTVLGENEGLQPWQFFDVESDPYELNNLIDSADHQPLIREYHQMLRQRMEETGDHAWLGEAFGIEALNAWMPCHIGG